ncbi:MAG: hypothetical protein IKY83_02850 [Proteobacteria bacterium]|nr:hypothetical protein [Pseudomonadota bacterium]
MMPISRIFNQITRLAAPLSLCIALAGNAFAQAPESPDPRPQADAHPDADPAPAQAVSPQREAAQTALEAALKATPPERSKAAKTLAEMPEIAATLDQWIAQTPIDDPQNLILKELLLAMPLKLAGPRLTELAKKSSDPNVQRSWENWLQKYPDAYASVLVSWLRLSNTNPPQFTSILNKYAALRPDDALHIWAQLIASYPIRELEHVAAFGLRSPSCTAALAQNLATLSEDTPILRTLRAIAKCESPTRPDDTADLTAKVRTKLDADAVSSRIAAITAAGHLQLADKDITDKIASIYADAKNTTERSAALRALEAASPSEARLADALQNGDETLRFTASELLLDRADAAFPTESVESAFARELWPDTQLNLYRVLARRMPDGAEKTDFQRTILLDASRAEPLRLAALNDLSNAPDAVSLDDMAALQRQEAPLDLIASTAERIYKSTPEARPTLRTWLNAQQPFERRILATFARFMQIDQVERDTGAIESMRKVCSESHENILQTCINYFESNAQNDSDRELLKDLQRKKAQIDAMMNIEF